MFKFIAYPSPVAAATSDSMQSSLHLLQGLFVYEVLKLVLKQKLWRVNYKLDPLRTRLAVLYYSKTNPTAKLKPEGWSSWMYTSTNPVLPHLMGRDISYTRM